MDKALEAIRDAWEGRSAAGPKSSTTEGAALAKDDDKAYKLADKFVDSHADLYAGYEHLSLDILVKLVDEARERGDEETVWKTQAYLFHKFEPQNIGGTYHAKLRSPNG